MPTLTVCASVPISSGGERRTPSTPAEGQVRAAGGGGGGSAGGVRDLVQRLAHHHAGMLPADHTPRRSPKTGPSLPRAKRTRASSAASIRRGTSLRVGGTTGEEDGIREFDVLGRSDEDRICAGGWICALGGASPLFHPLPRPSSLQPQPHPSPPASLLPERRRAVAAGAMYRRAGGFSSPSLHLPSGGGGSAGGAETRRLFRPSLETVGRRCGACKGSNAAGRRKRRRRRRGGKGTF